MTFQLNAYARLGRQTRGVNFSASTGWGDTPAQMSLVAPADAFDLNRGQIHDLVIRQEGLTLRWRRCRIASIEEAEPASAGMIKVVVEDRRWQWQFGSIDGDYNVVGEDGNLIREKTPRQLAKLLAIAMGDPRLDVSDLPNSARPRKTWRGSNPRTELSQLCSDYGCVVVFNGHLDSSKICKVGVGEAIPQQPVVSEARGYYMPAWPNRIVIDTSPTVFQRGLEFFEAVGMDTDGKVKPINDLSYKPAAGWGNTDPIEFIDIDGQYTSEGQTVYARDLAAATVWRWYRLTGLKDMQGWAPEALQKEANRPRSRDDIGPFLDSRLDRDFATGNRLPITAFGSYYDDRENGENTPEGSQVKIDFTLDDKTKTIRFSEPVYVRKELQADVYQAASITVYCGFAVVSEGVPVRYQRSLPLKANRGAGPRVEIHDEILREIIEQAPFGLPAKDNKAEVDAECDAMLNAMVGEYEEFPTATPTVPYLGNFECDGILRSISWNASSTDAVTTQLAYNGELNEFIPDFRDTPQARAKRLNDQAARQRQAIQNGQLKPVPPI